MKKIGKTRIDKTETYEKFRKNSCEIVVNQLLRSTIYRFTYKKKPQHIVEKSKTPLLVDKRGVFVGWGGGIRTHAYSSQSAVSYRLTTPQRYGGLSAGISPAANRKRKSQDQLTLRSSGVGNRGRTDDLQGHNLAL